MVSKITTPITPLEQTEKINEIIDNLGIGGFNILEHKWSDHIINDISWLRADTFSWQSGAVYVAAYNHLVADYNGGTSQTETVGSYTITYVLATDGHKITTDETTVANIYNESGVAWYYVLDTANQRFKLPRELPITDKSKGNGITLGLTDGTKNSGLMATNLSNSYNVGNYENHYGVAVGTTAGSYSTNSNKTLGITTDPTKSGIISHRANENGKQYLYFYVGQFSQSATEQTAGLNSELFNGKVDLDASNLSTTGKSLISGLGMPSNRYIDLTRGASGATYSMTSNGWLAVGVTDMIANSGVLNIKIDGIEVFNEFCHQTQHNKTITVPVRKGSVVTITYTGNFFLLKFIYAEGEPNV